MKYAVITGASKGIGRATARYFLSRGYQVISIARHPCEEKGALSLICDLSQKNWSPELKQKIDQIIPSSSTLCLIHSASTHGEHPLQELSPDRLRKDLEINLVGALQVNQLVLEKMAKGSSILYLGSTLSQKAVAGCASYVIAKHAVVGMMRSTCQDLKDRPIHTACICPGFTDTEMLRQHLNHDIKTLEQVKSRVGAHRLIEPEEIANTLYFCAENPVINGAVIHANLGQIEN